jgi:hypothetical protein
MVIGLNDASEVTRTALVPILPRIIGTKAAPDVEHARSLLALDWLIRVWIEASNQ